MSDVLLISVPFRARGIPVIFPIHLAALGSYLADRGHRVRVMDLNVEPPGALAEALRGRRYDLVGAALRNVLPFFWIDRFRPLRRVVAELRAAGVTPVVGGPGFSLFAPAVFRWVPELRVGVIGEGEDALARLAAGEKPETIPGVCRRTPEGLASNYPPRFLPGPEIPRYRDLEGLRVGDPRYLVGVQSYRGCAYECAHCPVRYLRGDEIRPRPLDAVRDDLLFLRARGVRHAFLIDGVFHHPLDRSRALLALFRELGHPTSWEGFLKPGPDVTADLLREAAAAGGIRFHVDLITGSPRLGPLVNNHADPRDATRIATLLRDAGLQGVFYFAYDLPTETLSDERKSLRLMRRLRAGGHGTSVYPFYPYPGTRFETFYGRVLDKSALWHLLRVAKLLLRPSFPFFLRDMTRHDRLNGPKEISPVGAVATAPEIARPGGD